MPEERRVQARNKAGEIYEILRHKDRIRIESTTKLKIVRDCRFSKYEQYISKNSYFQSTKTLKELFAIATEKNSKKHTLIWTEDDFQTLKNQENSELTLTINSQKNGLEQLKSVDSGKIDTIFLLSDFNKVSAAKKSTTLLKNNGQIIMTGWPPSFFQSKKEQGCPYIAISIAKRLKSWRSMLPDWLNVKVNRFLNKNYPNNALKNGLDTFTYEPLFSSFSHFNDISINPKENYVVLKMREKPLVKQ